MIRSYLERGAELSELDDRQLAKIEEIFVLYLVKGITFLNALERCSATLQSDQYHLRSILKAKLAIMIEDPICNMQIKPALLMLANGDARMFREQNADAARSRYIIRKHRHTFDCRLRAVKFDDMSLRAQERLSLEYLSKVQAHSKWFAHSKAHFITKAEHGLTHDDIVRNLQMIALRAFRWYYPFLDGAHMLNTMRRSITNRGNSYVKYSTADVRKRLVMTETGEMYNRESSGAYEHVIDRTFAAAYDPQRGMNIALSVQQWSQEPTHAPVVQFVMDPTKQDEFISWFIARYVDPDAVPGVENEAMKSIEMESAMEYIRRQGQSYTRLLSHFLKHPHEQVVEALQDLRATT